MGINTVWKSEDGTELGRVDDPRGVLSTVFIHPVVDLTETVCLRFLDPYGDACFNHLQTGILAAELRAAAAACDRAEIRDHLLAVAALADKAGETHTYLWFVGD